ncbi:MAG: acyl carrier protein [Bacteroidota bacterium]|nr:acyl carrier protein [Bacteroidota bacterium]
MEVNEYIKLISDQFEETDKAVFNPETKFRELEEWSSLIALAVMAITDKKYGVVITVNEMRQMNTIKDLFELVESKRN